MRPRPKGRRSVEVNAVLLSQVLHALVLPTIIFLVPIGIVH